MNGYLRRVERCSDFRRGREIMKQGGNKGKKEERKGEIWEELDLTRKEIMIYIKLRNWKKN